MVSLHTNNGFWWRGVHYHPGDAIEEASDYWGRVLNWLRLTETAGGGGGGPEWLPEGAIAFADFANAHFYAGGAERTLPDVQDGDNTSLLIGPLLTDICANDGRTVIYQSPLGSNFDVTDADFNYGLYLTPVGDGQISLDLYGPNSDVVRTTANDPAPPVDAKVAVSYSLTGASLSVAGGAVVTATSSGTNPLAALGYVVFGAPNDGVLTVYDYLTADADLPALSALS